MLYSWCVECQIQRGHVTRVGGRGNVTVYTYKVVCILVAGGGGGKIQEKQRSKVKLTGSVRECWDNWQYKYH